MQNHLRNLWEQGCDFLGSYYAILGGAMTWVSEPNLVSAISNAGGFGVLACGSMPADLLVQKIQETRDKTKRPFGVNLILMHPQLKDLVKVCVDQKVSHVFLAGGFPDTTTVTSLKEGGIKVVAFAPSYIMARKLIRMEADALVIEGTEAGGHIGPVSTTVLAQEILPKIKDIPVFVAGGIGSGAGIAAYLQMGAAGCQLGTKFVCAHESQVHANFKQAFIRANARDAVVSQQIDDRFPVIPVRGLYNQGAKAFLKFQREMIQKVDQGEYSLKEGQLEIEHFWAGALRKAAIDGDIENGSLMAGQSVGMVISEQSTKEIIENLVQEAEIALASH